MGLTRRAALLLVLLALLLAAPAHSRKKKARTEWDTAVLEALDTDECTVERVAAGALSRERFDKEFRHRQPVLIEGLASAEEWPAMSRGVWQRRELLDLYGERIVQVRDDTSSDRIKQKNGAGGSKKLTLRRYVERFFDRGFPPGTPLQKLREVNYQIDQDFMQESAPELMEDFSVPPLFASLTSGLELNQTQAPFFFLGARGSGVGFHRHGEAWNGVVHGRKRFFLFRPEWKSGLLGIAPDLPYDGLQWFKRFFSKTLSGTALAPIECVTTPGDILYIPESWHHATLNVADTVGVAVNHLPQSWEESRTVPPEEYHWEVAPRDALSETAAADALDGLDVIDAGESLLEYCPSLEDEETCRMSWQVNAAVVMLDKYVLAEEDNGGVPQPEKLSDQALSDAEAAFQLLAEALGDGPPNDNAAASLIWARGAFVVGLARQGPGMYEDQDEATRMLTSALAHGYEPVGFREHVAAIEAVRRRSSGEGEGSSDEERASELKRGASIVDSALRLPSSWHGINIYSRAGLSIAKAAFLMELEEPELALDAIGNALTSNPALPAAFMMKSKVYSHIGQHDRAAESLQEMVTVLGDVCQRCKDTPGADCGEGADETFIKASVPGGCDEVRRASMILEARDEKIRKMQEGQ